jgi:hypothetical protein
MLIVTTAWGASQSMEPSFVANPYVQASAPSSRKIRAVLDREEASYEAWRRARKPIRLLHASLKLNSPLKTLVHSRSAPNQLNFATTLHEKSNAPETGLASHSDVAGQKKPRVSAAAAISSTLIKRKGALVTGGLARSAEVLPRLASEEPRPKQAQFGQAGDTPSRQSEVGILISTVAGRKAARRHFQHYMYDFHSRQVFSFARSEEEEAEDAVRRERAEKLWTAENSAANEGVGSDGTSSARWSTSSEDTFRQELHDPQNGCILGGLGFLRAATYDALFENDWKLSDAEKSVRDAVDRKRIRESLRRAYRMLLWFFRYYAGNAAYAVASERRASTGMAATLSEGLFEIPSRVCLLEDLNVQCVDGPRFGVTDSPLKRENLIDFLLSVARMMCTHASNPNRLKMAISEGIEMSEAVKTLVQDHFGVFAQIQDVDHFRSLFLRKPDAFTRLARKAIPRRLQSILEIHRANLANFYDELVCAGASTRSGGLIDRPKRQGGHGIACSQFLSSLRAVNLITSRGTATPNASTGGEASGVDEVRAVRIFLSCLPLTTIDGAESEGASTTATATATSSTASAEPRELTLPQFLEALLRVAFTWKELQICHGGFDVCPNQMTSDCCHCTLDSAHYAFDVFDDAVEEIFARIHAHRLTRAQHRTSMRMKSMRMKSHRSLHSLVGLAGIQRASARLLPVESVADAGA